MNQIRKAQRKKSRLRIGLSGPSGSGKTYSALLLASGLAPWDKICIIDTENGSADLYEHLGEFNVITLEAPYSPERYKEAIKMAEDAGMEVIIIDSVSHEWDGSGGILESNDLVAQTKFKGNTGAAWSVSTPKHQAFLYKITTCKTHIITTARSKTETTIADGKVKKLGIKDIQREGFEYELTIGFNLDRDGHYATVSKDRTSLFIARDPFKITKETGEELKAWADKGIEVLEEIEHRTSITTAELIKQFEAATSLVELLSIWEKYPEFTTDEEVKTVASRRKQELKEESKPVTPAAVNVLSAEDVEIMFSRESAQSVIDSDLEIKPTDSVAEKTRKAKELVSRVAAAKRGQRS